MANGFDLDRSPGRTQRLWLAMPLLGAWLIGMIYAFWWFQVREYRAFPDPSAGVEIHAFSSIALTDAFPSLVTRDQATMVHFWNSDCQCNRFNNAHVRQIISDYQQRGVDFITVVKSQQDSEPERLLSQAESLFGIPAILDTALGHGKNAPVASPAAAIIDTHGGLRYYGPYSDSAYCGAQPNGFVERALNKVLAGDDSPAATSSLAFGCFCSWQSSQPSRAI